jgi:hypothetical protein
MNLPPNMDAAAFIRWLVSAAGTMPALEKIVDEAVAKQEKRARGKGK